MSRARQGKPLSLDEQRSSSDTSSTLSSSSRRTRSTRIDGTSQAPPPARSGRSGSGGNRHSRTSTLRTSLEPGFDQNLPPLDENDGSGLKDSDVSGISLEETDATNDAAANVTADRLIPNLPATLASAMEGQNDTIEIKDDTIDLAADSVQHSADTSSNLSAGFPSSSGASFASEGASRESSNDEPDDESDDAEETPATDEEALIFNSDTEALSSGG